MLKLFSARISGSHVPGLNRQVALFFIYSLLFHIGLFGITDVLLNFYLVSIGHDPETISLLQALPRLSGFLTGIPIGLLANRLGNRRIIIISTWGVALCVASTVMVQGLLLLALSRFMWGIFFGAGQVVKPPFMVTLTTQSEYTSQFSYHNLVSMTAVSIGSAFGGILPLLVSNFLSISGTRDLNPEQMPLAYQGAILIASLMILLSTVPLFLLSDNRTQPEPSTTHGETKSEQSIPWMLILKLSFPLLIFGVSGGLTFPFLNLFFREQFAIADSAVGSVLGLGWFMMGIFPLMNPIWEARVGRVIALAGLMIVSSIAFVGLGMAQTLTIAILFYVIAIGVRNTMQPLFQPLFMDSLPSQHHNIASSIGLVLWNIGWFVATISFGYLQATLGYGNIMILVAFFVLLNGVTIYLIFRR
jgi:MFS family permease